MIFYAYLKKYYFPLTFILFLIPLNVLPDDASVQNVTDIIVNGFNEYRLKRVESAIKEWTDNGPLEAGGKTRKQKKELSKIKDSFGKYYGFIFEREYEITEKSKIYFISIDHEKGSAFAMFTLSKPAKEWLVTEFDFSGDPGKILPDSFFLK